MNIMKVAQDIQIHGSELNIKFVRHHNNHTLALVIYMLSAFNINTIKKTTNIVDIYATQYYIIIN